MSRLTDMIYQRSKILEQFSKDAPALKYDKLELQLFEPSAGWIDARFFVNDKETDTFDISDVYIPFEDIKIWLEEVVQHRFECTPTGLNIDSEGYNVMMYYEPLFFDQDQFMLNDAPLCGLFYVYNSGRKKITTAAYCKTKQLVELFYKTILTYAETMLKKDPSFADDWILPEADCNIEDEDVAIKETFKRMFVSEDIEKFLSDSNGEKRFMKIR